MINLGGGEGSNPSTPPPAWRTSRGGRLCPAGRCPSGGIGADEWGPVTGPGARSMWVSPALLVPLRRPSRGFFLRARLCASSAGARGRAGRAEGICHPPHTRLAPHTPASVTSHSPDTSASHARHTPHSPAHTQAPHPSPHTLAAQPCRLAAGRCAAWRSEEPLGQPRPQPWARLLKDETRRDSCSGF